MKKQLLYSISLAVVVIAGGVVLYFYLDNNRTIEPVVNQEPIPITVVSDNQFTLQANTVDSLGVDPESTFTLTSKSPITEDMVASSLQIEPAFSYKLESSDSNTFTLIPKENLSSNTVYAFSLAAEQSDTEQLREFQWAYQIKDTFKITGTLPRDEGTSVPTNSGIEIIFSHENYTNYEQYITFSPKIEGKFEKYRKTLVFIPDSLETETLYTVTVEAGLPLNNSQEALEEDYVFEFETVADDNSTDYISFEYDFFEYPETDIPLMTLYASRNASQTNSVTVWSFPTFEEFGEAVSDMNSVPRWAYYARRNNLYPTDSLNEVASFEAEIKTEDYIEYIEFPESLPMGQYLVEVTSNDKKDQAFLQVTDLAASLVGSNTESGIWLHKLSTELAVDNAQIGFSHDEQFSARTDTNGLATFDTPTAITSTDDGDLNQTYYYTASAGDDQILIPIDQHYERGFWYSFGYPQSDKGYWSYIYTNRTLYLPTDSLKFWGLAKDRTGAALTEVRAELVSQNYYSSNSQEVIIDKQELKISDFDTYQGTFDYTNLNPGTYHLRIFDGETEITSTYVSIQTYTKPPYKIDVTTPKKAIFEGENAVFDVQTQFFDGTPVPFIELEYQSSFGNGTVITDENGIAQVDFATSYSDSTYYPSYRNFSVHPTQAEVTDINGWASVYVFGPRYDIDLTAERSGVISGTIYNITLDTINADGDDFTWDYQGDPVPNVPASITIYHSWYEKIETGTRYDFINKTTYKTYRYDYHEDLVQQQDVTTDQNGTFTHSFVPDLDTSYQIVVDATDTLNQTATTTRYIYTGPRYFYNSSDYDSYYLLLDKDPDENQAIMYTPGENVSATFLKNEEILPSSTDNRFMYFKDQNGLFDIGTSNSPYASFDFLDSYAPNIYLLGQYFDGRSYHLTSANRVDFDRTTKELSIDIQSDKDQYRPGDKVQLDFTVTDSEDEPVVAEVNVSAIDEALAAIQWDNPVTTLSSLYKYIGPSLTQVYQSHKELMSPQAEGGGCFSGEMKVRMSDGSLKEIEDVTIGEKVLTKENEQSNKLVEAEVIGKTEHTVNEFLTINDQLDVTPEHIIYINDQWQPVENAKVGDYMLNESGERVEITSIESRHVPVKVYNLHTSEKHTFIINGIYVHNEKGGGRENFQDIAVFESVTTNSQGKTNVQFTLPDNVTAWQTTVQAVTKDLKAAGEQTAIVATLPFFVDIAVADTYLTSDQPKVKIRTFGKELSRLDSVTLTISFPNSDFDSQVYSVKGFEAVEVELPQFTEGRHAITVEAKVGTLEDKVTKYANYLDTNHFENAVNYYLLEEDLDIEGSDQLNSTLTFMNKERGQYYNSLKHLNWYYGDRLDQKMARYYAQSLLSEYFDEGGNVQEISFTDFQTPEGGIAILPYASSEILFTAKVLELASDVFDQEAAKDYFTTILNNKDANVDEIVYAFFGMANLGEPVLTDILLFLENQELSPQLKLYMARGLANLGAVEYASTILEEILENNAEALEPYARINLGETQDDITEYTYQAAILAAEVSSPFANPLYSYAERNRAQYQLNTLEQLSYLSKTLPLLSGEPVSFSYTLNGSTESVSLKKNEKHSVLASPADLDGISFSNISGAVGLIVTYPSPIDIETAVVDDNLSISREYSVNGQTISEFSENDVVKITLSHSISSDALDNSYQITDYLPAGLKLLTRLSSRGISYDTGFRYPYEVNGQAVKFWTYKFSTPFYYYAIVVGKGTYTAEAPTVQGFVVKESKTYGTNEQITIE